MLHRSFLVGTGVAIIVTATMSETVRHILLALGIGLVIVGILLRTPSQRVHKFIRKKIKEARRKIKDAADIDYWGAVNGIEGSVDLDFFKAWTNEVGIWVEAAYGEEERGLFFRLGNPISIYDMSCYEYAINRALDKPKILNSTIGAYCDYLEKHFLGFVGEAKSVSQSFNPMDWRYLWW